MKKPRYTCLSKAKASNSHKMWTEVSSSVPQKIIRGALFPEPSFVCLSKVPENKPHPGSPTGAPMERIAHLQSLLSHVFQIPHKNTTNNRNFHLLSKAPGKEHPSMFPKNGAPMETNSHFQSRTYDILLGPPKGALPQRETLRIQSPPSFIFQSPW